MSRARVTSIVEVAPAVFDVQLAPRPFTFEPGQYVSIRIPDTREHRSYSIASSPDRRDGFGLLVRASGGSGSRFLASLTVGEELELDGPSGDFRLAPGFQTSVFGATGVGIAPLFPMMEALLARPGEGRVLLLWGLANARDAFWRERLAALAQDPRFAYRIVIVDDGDGFVTQPLVDTALELVAPTYYLCGNGQMMKDVVHGLVASGIDRAQIRTDLF